MTRRHAGLIVGLFLLPILCFVAAGAYQLWRSGSLLWLWWILPACWGASYLLARRALRSARAEDFGPHPTLPAFWTPRDREAWRIVEKAAEDARKLNPVDLVDARFYLRAAEKLSLEIARFYHPDAKDPISDLTVPEILAAAELALEDLSDLVTNYVPGSRHLTVRRWRMLGQAPAYYTAASNLGYAISALFGPTSAVSRYLVSRLVLGPAMELMQQNLVLWFYASFLNRVGLYAIEMNSGRLLRGARVWRSLVEKYSAPRPIAPEEAGASSAEDLHTVSIAVVGQVKAGKSSLVNALLGEARAGADVLPLTRQVSRYELREAELSDRLVLWDTKGYAFADPNEEGFRAAVEVARAADLVLLVLEARNPSRESDVRMLRALDAHFRDNPRYRRPPVVAVLTHIDQLSPLREWEPPYEGWRDPEPARPKERSIRDAVEYNRQALGKGVVDVVPVCSDVEGDRVHGVDEWLFPELVALLDEARAVLLVRTLHARGAREAAMELLGQARRAGMALLRAAWAGGTRLAESHSAPPAPPSDDT